MGRNPDGSWARLDQLFLFPFHFSIFTRPSRASPADSTLELAQLKPSAPVATGRSGHRVWTRSTNLLAKIWPNKRTSDTLGLKPDPNLSSYLLSCRSKLSLPLSYFSLSAAIWSRFRDWLVRILNPLRVGIKTPINRRAIVQYFLQKPRQNLATFAF
jgi:hypothetical protein